MKLKNETTEQKLRGAYYTPLPLAAMMVNMFGGDPSIETVLEPSCGDGVFLDALVDAPGFEGLKAVTAIEIEDGEADKLSQRMRGYEHICVMNQDFFNFYEENAGQKKYDLILGNPPYVRYQYLEETQRELMSRILTAQGMKANKLVNTWVGFMVACVNLLSDTGRLAFVIPAEILQVVYAQELRLFLANQLSSITLITFEELIFPDIEQEVLVFVGEKRGEEKGIRIIELDNLEDLKSFDMDTDGFQKLQHVHEKWTKYFTDEEENALVARIRSDARFQKLSDTALINVGITTGNNRYFSVNQQTVAQYELKNVVRPLIGRSAHANSVYFRKADWKKNVEAGKPAYLIDFPAQDYETYPPKHKEYIELGEAKEEHKGYKCSIRDRWYRIPSIWIPDAFFLRRNNLYPKFVLNCCDAVSTDTMHRIKFYDGVSHERILLSYYNSISFAFTELCGRSYGGGVLEILPSEVGNIMIPRLDAVPIEQVRQILRQIDRMVRKEEKIEKVLDLVDQEILADCLGFEMDLCRRARGIWKKLQARRLRRG